MICSLPRSQELVTCVYLEPLHPSPHPHSTKLLKRIKCCLVVFISSYILSNSRSYRIELMNCKGFRRGQSQSNRGVIQEFFEGAEENHYDLTEITTRILRNKSLVYIVTPSHSVRFNIILPCPAFRLKFYVYFLFFLLATTCSSIFTLISSPILCRNFIS